MTTGEPTKVNQRLESQSARTQDILEPCRNVTQPIHALFHMNLPKLVYLEKIYRLILPLIVSRLQAALSAQQTFFARAAGGFCHHLTCHVGRGR